MSTVVAETVKAILREMSCVTWEWHKDGVCFSISRRNTSGCCSHVVKMGSIRTKEKETILRFHLQLLTVLKEVDACG